jgi:hypothetical protein
VLGHRGEPGGILLGEQPLEEAGHLGLERGDRAVDALDPALDRGGVCLELVLQVALATADPILGLLPDLSDLRLGPLADSGHVLVGVPTEGGGFIGGPSVDLLDVSLRFTLEPGEGLLAGGLGGRLHRLRQVGQELAGSGARRRGRRTLRSSGRAGGLGGGKVGLGCWHGSRLRGVGRRARCVVVAVDVGPRIGGRGRFVGHGLVVVVVAFVGAPGEPEAGSRIGRRHGAFVSSPSGLDGVWGVSACSQAWTVRCSPLEVPPV